LNHALLSAVCLTSGSGILTAQKIDPDVIEMAPFVVYSGLIDVVDGFTGEPYHKVNPVVDGFRDEFNDLLLGYHRTVLKSEYAFLVDMVKRLKGYERELSALGERFGMRPVTLDTDRAFIIEKVIFHRLLEDPFFKIESLVVWDHDRLERMDGRRPVSKYSRDIRFNPESGKWERRVLTRWEVAFRTYKGNGGGEFYEIIKEQGLNLDTNEGFHFINRGLTGKVTPGAFKDVRLTYPIFVSSKQPAEQQVEQLRTTLLENLSHIYDPFSWAWRRNERYHANTLVLNQVRKQVKAARIPVVDPEWFEAVLSQFLHDVATIKLQGIEEIYTREMLRKVRVNRNILGRRLDLLNWNDDEARSVPYDPGKQSGVRVNFQQPGGARFILIDAYRRFPERFIEVLGSKLAAPGKKKSGMDLIREAIEETSGVPAEIYIRKASQIQEDELERRRFVLD
jgi:hypothetical protein